MKPKATTGLFGAMGVGAMIGLFYSACVFPLLAPVLTFLLSHPSTLSGTGLLSSFGLGLSSPLIALGLMTGGTSDLVLRKIYKRENIVAKVSGGVLVLVGIWFLWTLFRIIT